MKRLFAVLLLLIPLLLSSPASASSFTFPNIVWKGSPNYDEGRGGYKVDLIILHTTESSWDSATSWLTNPYSSASAHYIVDADGSRIDQMVKDSNTAWAAGNYVYNQRAINIEQVGYAAKGGFSDGLYQATGTLVGIEALEFNIPLDRQHVIGHMNVPDPDHPDMYGGQEHHNDPGPYYDFNRVLAIAQAYEDSQSAPVQPCTFYKETGFSSCYGFRAFYDSFGKNAVGLFGYPISSEFQINGVTMQYYQRARLEWHPEATGFPNNPYHVTLGLVGTEDYRFNSTTVVVGGN